MTSRDYAMTAYSVVPGGNRKLGKARWIWSTHASEDTCPTACPFRTRGCYALYLARGGWRALRAHGGLDWHEYLAALRALPWERNSILRLHVSGDLPGDGEFLNRELCLDLCNACDSCPTWTYTHYSMHSRRNVRVVRAMLLAGVQVRPAVERCRDAVDLYEQGISCVLVVADRVPDLGEVPVHVCRGCCVECRRCIDGWPGVVVFFPHGPGAGAVREACAVANLEDGYGKQYSL
jgi:hypothetical protein